MAEYTGKDGLQYCTECGEPLEMDITLGNEQKRVRCSCKCKRAEREAQEKREHEAEIARRRKICFGNSSYRDARFENSDDCEAMQIAKKYADNFKEFKAQGKGLLLYGTVGTGKSRAAACIANQLLDEGQSVLMTNFSRLCNELQALFEGRQQYIDSLKRYALLIIDDLGVERSSEFMQEQVFNIIDTRYSSGLPMIITTNLTAEEIKKPSELMRYRIYDRIMEKCHPIKIDGQSRRRQNLKNDFWQTEMMLKGGKK